MKGFQNLVARMRKAQIEYNKNPTYENLNYVEDVEDLEDEVDEYLDFCLNCKGTDYKSVKQFLKNRKGEL